MNTDRAYTAAERASIADALSRRQPAPCPVCAVPLSVQPVEPRTDVAYVRRRMWVLCPRCRRSAGIDVSAAGPP